MTTLTRVKKEKKKRLPRVQTSDGNDYSVAEEEAVVVERLKSLGFEITSRFCSVYNFNRKVGDFRILGTYDSYGKKVFIKTLF